MWGVGDTLFLAGVVLYTIQVGSPVFVMRCRRRWVAALLHWVYLCRMSACKLGHMPVLEWQYNVTAVLCVNAGNCICGVDGVQSRSVASTVGAVGLSTWWKFRKVEFQEFRLRLQPQGVLQGS